MTTIFVTATDTDAGKTYVTASVARQWRQSGIDAQALKPVACGADAAGRYADLDQLMEAQGLDVPDPINCYRFPTAAAPAQAAQGKRAIEPERLVGWCHQQSKRCAWTLVEGVGGLRVPLAPGYDVRDWIADLRPEAIWLVVRSRIGALNHLLLTLESLAAIGREPAAIILNAVCTTEQDYLSFLVEAGAAVAGNAKILTLGSGELPDARTLASLCPGGGMQV